MPYYQTWVTLQDSASNSSIDKVETNSSVQISSEAQSDTGKISSRETFTGILNLCCDLDLVRSNPIFPQNTRAYDAVLANQVWLQTNEQFRRYNRNSHILII